MTARSQFLQGTRPGWLALLGAPLLLLGTGRPGPDHQSQRGWERASGADPA